MLNAVRRRAGPDDVVAGRGADACWRIGRAIGLDGRDEELRDLDVAEIVNQPRQFRAECARVEREIARQILRSLHLEPPHLTAARALDREKPGTAEVRIEQPRDHRSRPRWPRTHGVGQLAQPAFDLPDVALQRERIAPRLHLFEKWLQ